MFFLGCFRGLYGQDKNYKCKYGSSGDISNKPTTYRYINNLASHPHTNWSVLTHNNKVVDNVCVWQDYNPDKEPNGINRTHLRLVLNHIRMVNVDDAKKTITLDIDAFILWKDDRIKAQFTSISDSIGLPPITLEDPSVIWTPFRDIQIMKLRKRTYLWDPSMMNIALDNVKTANRVFKNVSFYGDSPVVVSFINWGVTITCFFEFSNFPFDKNSCPLKLSFANLDVSLGFFKNSLARIASGSVMDGFKIKVQQLNPKRNINTRKGIKTDVMIYIHLQRQWLKYLYQYYIPCITIVIASSFSFIIPLTAIPGRVALVVTQFLTLTNIFINQQVIFSIVFYI